eukprot:5828622-Pyramimonas_sp.AAC.1
MVIPPALTVIPPAGRGGEAEGRAGGGRGSEADGGCASPPAPGVRICVQACLCCVGRSAP